MATMRGLIVAAVMALASHAGAAEPAGTITILEGDALIYRAAGRLHAAEGVRLAVGDIVETAASTLVQIELPDQSVIQFGPATRAMLGPRWFYVMNGWCKLAGPKPGGAGLELRTRLFDLPASAAVVVLQAAPSDATLFVERGDLRLAERQASGGPIPVSLRAGDYYARKGMARGSVNPGSTDAFLGAMPRAFRDSLPLRIERFRDADVRPKEAPDFSYADVEVWLKAEPWLRRPFVQRWRVKAHESAFRAALIANLPAHMEWDPILFPEKYLPKEPKRPASAPAPATARPAGIAPPSNP